MAIWIQSLSWALIYSIGQGFIVFSSLWLVTKMLQTVAANVRYYLSLFALSVLLAWFVGTWWREYHLLTSTKETLSAIYTSGTTITWLPIQKMSGFIGSDIFLPLQSLTRYFPLLCAGYAVGFAIMLIKLIAGMSYLFSLRRSSATQPGEDLKDVLVLQKERLRITAPVQLLISAKAQVPMVVGFIKPVILIPVAALAQLDSRQLETILLHELTHIKRHDYIVNIMQTIVETVLFFNPFVWIIGKIIRREREHCCDDMVVYNTTEPLFYATALTQLASTRSIVPPVVVAAQGRSTHLYDRIQRIMEVKSNPFSYSRMVATIVLMATIVGSVAWVRPTFRTAKGKSAVGARKATVKNKSVDTKELGSQGAQKGKVENTEAMPKTKGKQVAAATVTEEDLLVQRLLNDKLVDQVKGFVVERRNEKLFINEQQQPEEVAVKYLSSLKKELIRVQVFSMEDRLRMHPNANFLQLLLPVSIESPCVDKKPKEGC